MPLKIAVERRQSNRIVLGKAGQILDHNIVTPHAEIYAVGIFHQNILVCIVPQAVINLAEGINRRVVGTEINISDVAMRAVQKIQRPPTLVIAGNPRNRKPVHIRKQQKIILPDGRKTVLLLGSLGKPVVSPTVENRPAAPYNADISVPSRYDSAEIGVVRGVHEDITVTAVG